MKQFVITSAAGKRLIGKALVAHPAIRRCMESGTLVIIAGTTNGYVAEEILAKVGETGFEKRRFFRGLTLPPGRPTSESGRLPDESEFPGDVVLRGGVWQRGKTIFDVVDDLEEGDLILKGANALDLARRRAAILIGHPQGGTIAAALGAVIGRRVRLILPVGLEKRVMEDLNVLAQRVNAPGVSGPRLWPVPGEVFTELEAIELLTGASAKLLAAGGVCGAEGSLRLGISGETEAVEATETLLRSLADEPPFAL